MASMSTNCIFCKIVSGDVPCEKKFEDDTIIVFKDIKPAAEHHYLSVPKDHINNISTLTSDHIPLIEQLIDCGKQALIENGGDVNNVHLGFHRPPFNSVSHLHLHVIAPVSNMSFWHRMVFKPNSWWFISVDMLLEQLKNKKNKL